MLITLALITLYKSFIRPYTDYDDLSFHEKLESIQYNASLAIKGAIRSTLSEKL